MGTQEKGILMPGVDSCIVKDQKCSIIAKFCKKPAQTADGGLPVRGCLGARSNFFFFGGGWQGRRTSHVPPSLPPP